MFNTIFYMAEFVQLGFYDCETRFRKMLIKHFGNILGISSKKASPESSSLCL